LTYQGGRGSSTACHHVRTHSTWLQSLIEDLKRAEVLREGSMRQPSLLEVVSTSSAQSEALKPYAPHSEMSQRVQDACIVLAVGQKLSFNFLRSAEFKYFMNVVNPRCVIPHPSAFKQLLVDKCNMYGSIRQTLARGSIAVSFSADGWSDKNVHFLSLSMHTITQVHDHEPPKYRTEVLPFVHSEGSQTAELTFEQVHTSISSLLGDKYSTVGCITTDSASVMKKMARLLHSSTGIKHASCAIHRLQTWIDGYVKHAERKLTIMRLRAIVKKTRKSRLIKEAFHSAQEENGTPKR
jgi:hypothetical protein